MITTPSTGTRPPGLTNTLSPTRNSSTETSRAPSAPRTATERGKKSSRSRIARRPRETVRCSSTSAISTNKVMISAVKNSEIAAAARTAIDIESSIVIRRAAMFSIASLKIGQPPIRTPAKPMRLIRGNGSHTRNHTAIAHSATRPIRRTSSQLISLSALSSTVANSARACSCEFNFGFSTSSD